MNIELNPDVDLLLRQHVERAVRPVRAGKDRKLAMREELFAHLASVYAEESLQRADRQAAVAAALARFGEPKGLTLELNASVGRSEKWAFHIDRCEEAMNRGLRHWFSRRQGEPWHRVALRSLCVLVLFNLTIFVAIPLLVSVFVQDWPGDPKTLTQLPTLFLLNVVSQIATIGAIRHTTRMVGDGSTRSHWIWVTVQALVWSVLAAILIVPFRWSLAGSLPSFQEIRNLALSYTLGLSPFFVFSVWCLQQGRKYRTRLERWTNLAIDE